MPAAKAVVAGTGFHPSPGFAPPAGATNADVTAPISSRARSGRGLKSSSAAERNGHVASSLFRLHAHQHALLALGASLAERLAKLVRRGDRTAGHFENHVAGLEAVIGGRSL